MLRITEIKLPLDHSDEQLREAIARKLELSVSQVHDYSVFKRSYDARKKTISC
jgi:uncharacterized FAD-dependent dehydrogenase